jgi:hypothetical protein
MKIYRNLMETRHRKSRPDSRKTKHLKDCSDIRNCFRKRWVQHPRHEKVTLTSRKLSTEIFAIKSYLKKVYPISEKLSMSKLGLELTRHGKVILNIM